ncbi:MAG: BMP family protein [Gemmatimonadetes bacterium]|nr:BMP family protein [Gemmatimonadota bacterium]
MTIRRSVSLAFLAVAIACTKGDAPKAGTSAGGNAGTLRVALLTPGPISDQAWNGGAYAGLMRIKDSLGAQVSHVQTKSPQEFDENFRQYGVQGYDLVFGHGFEFQEAAARASKEFPRTIYVTTSGHTVGANLAGMDFAFEEGAYLAGMVAGSLTKTGILACIGGTELPPVKASFKAFELGVHAVNPKAQVLTGYIGNWDDVSAGKEQALAYIARGADVVFQNADAAGLGIIQAAREKKVYAVGANADQNAIAPETIIGSVVIDVPHALLSVAREVQEKRFTARVISLGLKEDVVRWTVNPALASRVSPALTKSVDSVTALLRAGTMRLPVGATSDSSK